MPTEESAAKSRRTFKLPYIAPKVTRDSMKLTEDSNSGISRKRSKKDETRKILLEMLRESNEMLLQSKEMLKVSDVLCRKVGRLQEESEILLENTLYDDLADHV